jgi:hypothetical protein
MLDSSSLLHLILVLEPPASCLMRLEPYGVVGEPACERPLRLIAEVVPSRRAVERPLEVELGDLSPGDLEASGREQWPDEGGHLAEPPG